MTDWQQLYRERLVKAEEAVSLVKPGDRLVFSSYGSEPQALIDALIATGRLKGVSGYQALRLTRGLLADAEKAAGFHLITYTPEGKASQAIAEGRADYLPSSIYRACRWVEDGQIPVDAALIHLSPPDDDGYCSFGISTDFASVAAKHRARTILAQINDRMPRTRGDSLIHVSRLDRLVEVSHPLPTEEPKPLDDLSMAVARHVAGLVPDGATLEMGVGGVPDAIMSCLVNHRDLGIHSGLVSDAMMPLVERGVVTGARKTIDRGLVITNQLRGTQRLYDWAAQCPMVEMRSGTYNHDPLVLGRLDNFMALNSAIQVDLRGQVNSEFLRGKQTSGTGGSIDFAIGASISRGGKSIIALPSTAGGGRHSRLVSRLADGVVTLPQSLVDYVVTEYGVAGLAGKTLRERARALIAIAHPNFQEQLSREAGV